MVVIVINLRVVRWPWLQQTTRLWLTHVDRVQHMRLSVCLQRKTDRHGSAYGSNILRNFGGFVWRVIYGAHIARNNWIWWIVTFLPVTEERNNGTSNSILTGWTQLRYSYRKSIPGTYQLMKPKYQTEDGIPLSVFMMDCPHGTIDFYAGQSSIDRNRLVTLGLTIKFIGGCCW